ncbi:MAG: saccharopine dehydrogenase NADP-binding domain-containing protein [Saprospiraceae bacterium]|nr:saccharopine dehydrogenase NADP-binding domain-containing protein [Saprospiraceae bacterium]
MLGLEPFKKIILFGAGRSATYLIDYLLKHSVEEKWKIILADTNVNAAKAKLNNHPNGEAVPCDIHDAEIRGQLIESADFVISMLPAFLHMLVAKDCILYGVDMATASYLSDELSALEEEIKEKGLVFASELGLDPGLDHMSAMKIFDDIKRSHGKITSFESYTGGLVAPESDNNPWHYKISWNPRNVVLAGQCTSQFLQHSEVKYIPYNRLFKEAKNIDVNGHGQYSMYVNRDSIKYIELYGLEGIETMIRGTFRGNNYCEAWSVLVDLGLTDNTTKLSLSGNFQYLNLIHGFLKGSGNDFKSRIESTIGRSISQTTFDQIEWLGLFGESLCPLENPTTAEFLEYVIVNKWVLSPTDRDLIVMEHKIKYTIEEKEYHLSSTLYREGTDETHTAMSELVGLPLAIYTRHRMKGKFQKPGCILPLTEDIYQPILDELEEMGIKFIETIHE